MTHSKSRQLSDAERHQLLVEWNDTAADYPEDKCIHQLFEQQAERTPEAIALVAGDEQLSYRELNQRANQLAHVLIAQGVGPEVLVGILIARSFEMVVGQLAILKAGGAYVPLDPEYPQERLQFMLADLSPRKRGAVEVLLTQSSLVDRFCLPQNLNLFCLDQDWAFRDEDDSNPQTMVEPDNLAYCIYTSGSTGQPKGVLIPHRGLLNLLFWHQDAFQVTSGDRATQLAAIAFDASVWEIWPYLAAGATLYLVGADVMQTPERLQEWLIANEITITYLPTPLAEILLSVEWPEESALRIMLTGGDKLHKFPDRKQPFDLINIYGPTENSVVTTSSLVIANGRTAPSIGRPISNTQLYLLDEHLDPVPIGVPGELHISGVGLARGYLNRPELTDAFGKFIKNPFGEGRLYKTGDLCRYLPDGNLEFLARMDHQVKIRGFRIELGEIGAVLAQHPAVRQSVVIARQEHSAYKQLMAAVVPNQEPAPEPIELRRFLSEKLPEYMVPAVFVMLDELPLTPNGKVDRSAISQIMPRPEELSQSFVPPRNKSEQQLVEMWQELLNLYPIGIHDNFFSLGGHSLLATSVIYRLRDLFQVELPLRTLFESPTIAGLAEQISLLTAGEARISWPVVVSAAEQRDQPFPLTDLQQAYWLGRQEGFELGQIGSHLYMEFESQSLDLVRLNQAWQRLIERHEMLRVVVRENQQQILPQVPPYQITLLDLTDNNQESVTVQLEAIRQEMSHRVYAPDQWPLFEIRATGFDQRVRLHLSFDALILDAWSLFSLFREWAELYNNPDASLPPLALSFRDYVLTAQALRERELSHEGSAYQQSHAYWFSRLASLPPAPELPLARNPSSVQPRFKRQQEQLTRSIWQQLKERASKASLTPSALLLAAFAELLTVWSKKPRLTINLTLAKRLPLHPQVNEVVGQFTSSILLEVDHSQPESFIARAKRLQQQLWQDLEHRYVSGIRLVQKMARQQGSVGKAMMPVVFTSTLGYPQSDVLAEGHFGEMIYDISQTPQVWLDYQVMEREGGLLLIWDVVEELFPAGLIDDMFDAYGRLLKQLATDESAWRSYQLVPQAQLEQRAKVNATERPICGEMLHTLFTTQVKKRASELAVISPQCRLTYQELYERANQVGHKLRQLGAKPNTLVAVVMEKGWEQVVAVLAILMSGAAYLPIDPDFPLKRQWHLLEQGEVRLALTQPHLSIQWPADIKPLSIPMDVVQMDKSALSVVQSQSDLAYVIYTSGSTGLPKGVMIDHRGAVNTILDINQRFGVGPKERVLVLSALNFDLSVYDIFGILAAGGTIVLPAASQQKNPAHWVELMESHQVTLWNSVPALMQMLVEYLQPQKIISARNEEHIAQSLRLALLSGDWIPVTLPDQIKRLWAGIKIISLGGATEASIWSIFYPIERVDSQWKSIPYGQPLQNQNFHVLNDSMEPCPVWVPGQLYIGGIGVAKGYWRDEEKSKTRFIMHRGERLYKTGDLGRYLPDGNIEFLGREDFQVKIRGHRIELGEIEAILSHSPLVREAVVIVQQKGTDDKHLVAYFVPAWPSPLALGGKKGGQTLEWQAEQLSYWHQIYEKAYRQPSTYKKTLNSAGWYDSYTGFPIPPRQVREWIEETVKQIRSHKPTSVLEIGCGTGMLLCRLAPHCVKYWGTDFSEAALAHTASLKDSSKELGHVILSHRQADNFEGIEAGAFDAVILNSVVQNFPSVGYLLRVLEGAVKAVKPGGFIFVGNVRSLPLLEAYHASVQLYKAPNDLTRSQLQQRVQQHLVNEAELVIDPAFFIALSHHLPQIKHVQLSLKRGREHNELTRFAVDVILHLGSDAPTVEIPWVDWPTEKLTLPQLRQLLFDGQPDLLGVRRVPNARLATEIKTLQWLTDSHEQTVAELRQNLVNMDKGIDPEELWKLSHDLPYSIDISWSEAGAPPPNVGGRIDVLFRRRGSVAEKARVGDLRPLKAWHEYTNDPRRGQLSEYVVQNITQFVQERLPDYMVPSAFVMLDHLPLTANGKVDRRALSEIIPHPQGAKKRLIPPRNKLELKLVQIWEDLLEISPIGIQDNFFELGGNSLFIIRFLNQLEKKLGLDYGPATIFRNPTIEQLASVISSQQ